MKLGFALFKNTLDCLNKFMKHTSSGRKRTYSESVRTKKSQFEELLKSYPVHFVLTGSGSIYGTFYDHFINESGPEKQTEYVVEPFLQLIFEHPSTTLIFS